MKLSLSKFIKDKLTPDQQELLYKRLVRLRRPAWFGTLRCTKPISQHWGYDRGNPVDRYYIEKFLAENSKDIQGRVLEVKDSEYTDRFGKNVTQRDVLDIDANNPLATVVADLAAADSVPSELFDCFILTQTLHLIYDFHSAVVEAHRLLKPGGVLLLTVPAVSRIIKGYGPENEYWRFTAASCKTLFGEVFGKENVTVSSYGNVLTAMSFLTGIAYEELSHKELETNDIYFPVILTVRGVKV